MFSRQRFYGRLVPNMVRFVAVAHERGIRMKQWLRLLLVFALFAAVLPGTAWMSVSAAAQSALIEDPVLEAQSARSLKLKIES